MLAAPRVVVVAWWVSKACAAFIDGCLVMSVLCLNVATYCLSVAGVALLWMCHQISTMHSRYQIYSCRQ